VQSAFRDSASVAAAGTGGGAGAAGAPSNDLAATPSPVVPAAQARVVKTATLALSVDAKRVATVADRVASIAAAAGGFVASTERHGGDDKSATLTLRVPASA
jgi:hypothetical protein